MSALARDLAQALRFADTAIDQAYDCLDGIEDYTEDELISNPAPIGVTLICLRDILRELVTADAA
jgi:hypothetical protein